VYPARADAANPQFSLLYQDRTCHAARTVYGVEPAVHPSSAGSGPMYDLCESIGIPAISLEIAHAGSNFHGPDENIRLDDFILGIKHIAATFREFADQM